jgi:hypothetical protein
MKLYAYGYLEFKEELTNEMLLVMIKIQNNIEDHTEGEERVKLVTSFHKLFREHLKLPNEIFVFGSRKDTGAPIIVFFHKEPDGKTYSVDIDENGIYIEVEGEEENGNINNE